MRECPHDSFAADPPLAFPGTLHRVLPFLKWLPGTTPASLRADAVAGVTVALVAIPQSLAYAQLAGLPAYYGLYAALIPTIVGALFGSSGQLSTGPVALTSLLTAASLAPLAAPGGAQYVPYAIALALLAGLFQIAFGVMRLGVLMNLLSHPVLMGFVNAAAILITLSQVPALFGVRPPRTSHAVLDAWQVLIHTPQSHGHSIAFGAAAIAMLIGFRRYAPRLPGVLIVVAALTALSYLLDFARSGGRVVGDIPHGLPALALPSLDSDAWLPLLPAAFVIAVISFMEAMSSGKIAAIRTATKWDENQELIGQGLAKVAAALSQTMPVSGSFSRSALNLAAGARTGLSSIVCALCVLLMLLFFTPLLRHLPLPVLAGIIVMALASLINVRSLLNAWRASRDDAVAAVLTFVSTIVFAPNIQNGIIVGILASLALFIYRRMRPGIEVIEPGSTQLGGALPEGVADALGRTVAILRFDASLVFVNVSYFERAVLRLGRRHPELKSIVVLASAINSLDASGVEMLASLTDVLRRNGIDLVFCGVKPQVRAVMDRTGLVGVIGTDNLFPSLPAACAALARRAPTAPD